MSVVEIRGLKPYDGRYELDLARGFTVREWGWIKRLTDWMPATIGEALEGADAELVTLLGLIALHRAGRVDPAGVRDLWERTLDDTADTHVRLELDEPEPDEEDDAGPPRPSSNASSSTSGDGSSNGSATSPPPASGSGSPPSDTSESHPAAWAI